MKTLAKNFAEAHDTTQVGLALFAMWMTCAILLIIG